MVSGIIRAFVHLLMVIGCTLSSNSYAQTASTKPYIQLTLDIDEIFLNDAVVLEVESTGLLDPIDLSPLNRQATMVRETTGTRIAVIGGKVVEIRIRRMDLIPKRPGVVIIGPLTAGEISSNSVHIKVLDSTRPDWQPDTNDLQIHTTITPEAAWVNQQVEFTINLLHRYPISNEVITLPEMSDFSVREVFSNRRTYKTENREWFQTSYRYLIFPKRSGTLTLGNIQWSGTVAKSRIERAEFSREQQSITLPVDAAPDDSAKWWLPSENVQLTETWSTPPTALRAGDELERTINIQAGGVMAGQIPSPAVPESRALKQTLINSNRTETLTNSGLNSNAYFTYRVKAQSPIPVFLDTIRVEWWNTVTNELKEAIIPARRINVGLPDRADVLSKLAIQETGINRIKHWLQSTDKLRLCIYAIATLSLAGLFFLYAPKIIKRVHYQSLMQHHFKTLHAAASDGNAKELYRLIQQPESKKLLAGADSDLIKILENHLFSTNPRQEELPLKDMLKSLREKTNKQSNGRNKNQPNQLRALAEL